MPKIHPMIHMYMATIVHSIEAGEPLEDAAELMKKLSIRHLPVTLKGKLVGILSERDVNLAGSIMGDESNKLPVIDVCNQHPYTVSPETSLADVATTMADKHYGSAIVVKDGKLAGIFTAIDACRVLADLVKIARI